MTLHFISKKRPYRRYAEDVNIKAVESNGRKGISIVFKNKAKERITKSGYLSLAITEDRVYFAEKTKDVGYKASNNGEYTFRANIVDEDLHTWAKAHEGSYPLEYDDELKYYYIDLRG